MIMNTYFGSQFVRRLNTNTIPHAGVYVPSNKK